MITSAQCLKKYGEPTPEMERKHLILWDVPQHINDAIPALPNKIYCNKDLIPFLEQAFNLVILRKQETHIKTWDGCFNIRKKRGLNSLSIHAWAMAIDINAAWNGLNREPTMPHSLVQCFKDAGFDWGGDWKRKDGMHFQPKILPS